jgi:hypothetical protein
MNAVDLFETSLLEDLSMSSTQLGLPIESLAKIPNYPFPLTIGEKGEEVIVLCTGEASSSGVPNGKIEFNPTFFSSQGLKKSYPLGTKVTCSPSFKFFEEIHSFMIEMAKEYRSLVATFSNFAGVSLETEGVIAGTYVTSIPVTVIPSIQISAGTGIVSGRFASLNSETIIEVQELISATPAGKQRLLLIVLSEFAEISVIGGVAVTANPVLPSVPANSIALASVIVNQTGIEENSLEDLRNFISP